MADAAKTEALVRAALEWWSEGRTVRDWTEADLARAVVRYSGDWPGCPGCDHQCDEPCVPATEAEQLHAIDCFEAQLVHDGKLLAPDDYKPPENWKPRERPAKPAEGAEPGVLLRHAYKLAGRMQGLDAADLQHTLRLLAEHITRGVNACDKPQQENGNA